MNWQLSNLFSGSLMPRLSLWTALVVVMVMPIYPFVSTWFGDLSGQPLALKAAKDVLLFAMSVALLGWLLVDKSRRQQVIQDKLLWLIAGITLLSFAISALVPPESLTSFLAGVTMNGRYYAIFFLVYGALRYGQAQTTLYKYVLPWLAWVGVGLAVIGILQVFILPLNTLEIFGYQKDVTIAPYVLIDDNEQAPRAFATLRGPNDYGAFLLITILAAALLSRVRKLWAGGVALMVFALVLSSSRSAWLGLVMAVLTLLVLEFPRLSQKSKKVVVTLTIGAALIGGLLLALSTTIPALRLAVFHSSPDDTHLTEGSTDNHWTATGEGIERAIDQPLGCGLGCAGPASFYGDDPEIAENYFVQIAEEIGFIGLAIWLIIFVMIMKQLWLRRDDDLALLLLASGIGLSVIGVWLHVWADDPVSLVWWALAGLVLSRAGRQAENRLH